MNINKWIIRRYPKYHKLISLIFSEDKIKNYIKEYKFELAILLKDFDIYKTGTLFLVKKSGHMEENGWDGTYDIYGLFNCGEKVTSSGYHHISIYDESYYHIIDNAPVSKSSLDKSDIKED
jgi:hypothetical protein